MRMKKKRLFGILLTLALVLGLMAGMSVTAYAAPPGDTGTGFDIVINVGNIWSTSFTTNGGTIDSGVSVTADITLTIPDGVTLTVNDGIDATGKTVTVKGTGTLIVNGEYGANGPNGVNGADGGNGITGNLIIDEGASPREYSRGRMPYSPCGRQG